MSSILIGVIDCGFASFSGGSEALAGGYHMTFWCGNGVGVML